MGIGWNLSSTASCRCFPGDTCWPTKIQWNEFNDTVDGGLTASVPLAAICHDNEEFAAFNAVDCAVLQDEWYLPETHLISS